MGSDYYYRLNLVSHRKNRPIEADLIQICAFKAGDAHGGTFWKGPLGLPAFEKITEAADSSRMLTISTDIGFAQRSLVSRQISFFQLFVYDSRKRDNKIVGVMSCGDMTSSAGVSGDGGVEMTCEPLRNFRFQLVTLSFFDNAGGLDFRRT